MLPIIQQPWERDAAIRKALQKGFIATNPNRIVKVNASSFSTPPDTLGIPRWITISTKQGTSVHLIVAASHARLSKLEHPFTITTMGANPQELRLGMQLSISYLLPKYDADSLSLRLNIQLPESEPSSKKGFRQRLRGALGSGSSQVGGLSSSQAATQSSTTAELSVGSAPPSYEDATRW